MTNKFRDALACPFCGVIPHVCRGITPGTYKEDPAHGTICCENDLCGVNPSVDYYNGIEQGIYVWNTRAALSTDTAELVEVGYQYLFIDPMIGRDVWRHRSDEWNGQRPKASRKIYILKQEAGNNG